MSSDGDDGHGNEDDDFISGFDRCSFVFAGHLYGVLYKMCDQAVLLIITRFCLLKVLDLCQICCHHVFIVFYNSIRWYKLRKRNSWVMSPTIAAVGA